MAKASICTLVMTASLFFGLAACQDTSDAPPKVERPSAPAAVAPAEAAKHAGHGAKPGSHEDWCGEHQVPESLCSRCNPSLVAAFKATGDWCPEHGLPESQCLICNPELKIERPPRSEEARP